MIPGGLFLMSDREYMDIYYLFCFESCVVYIPLN